MRHVAVGRVESRSRSSGAVDKAQLSRFESRPVRVFAYDAIRRAIYINTYGVPTNFEELKTRRFVLHVAEQTQAKAIIAQYAPDQPWIGTVALQTNVASAHLWAVAKGAGIGWLPTYTHFIGGRVVPIEPGPRFCFEIWLTYHPDVAKIARV